MGKTEIYLQIVKLPNNISQFLKVLNFAECSKGLYDISFSFVLIHNQNNHFALAKDGIQVESFPAY